MQASLSSQLGAPVPGLQVPPSQTSSFVHASPSSQGPVAAAYVQPFEGEHWSTVHGSSASQSTDFVPPHPVALHRSSVVHASPSLHAAVLARNVHPPGATHASSVHGSPSEQVTRAPPTHWPPSHASLSVHASPSLHGPATGGAVQPTPAVQVSAVQGLLSSQSIEAPPAQVPSRQVSAIVHGSLSSQSPAALVCAHAPALHVSAVQGLVSSQSV